MPLNTPVQWAMLPDQLVPARVVGIQGTKYIIEIARPEGNYYRTVPQDRLTIYER